MPKTIHRPEYDVLRRLLRQARLDAGVTQVDLSEALERSQSFVSDIERGVRRLDVIELRDVCRVLGQNFLEFLDDLEAEIAEIGASRASRSRSTRRRTRA
jgi:transcriptional regulator with XRE-family HTH domain